MLTLATGLTKGFTILEILIVLAIISISGTSFYLILNQPKNFDSYKQTINEYKMMSIYSGNSYAFTKNSINILNQDVWEEIEVADFSGIYSVTNNQNTTNVLEEEDFFLIISPGNEISIKSITLDGGETVEL
tara:strand:- start:714 stop:1109 length:396 start_codon:yes stop_codon:yes gene_type:complete